MANQKLEKRITVAGWLVAAGLAIQSITHFWIHPLSFMSFLVIGTPLLILAFVFFYNPPAFLAGQSLVAYCMFFYMFAGTLDSVINANYGALFPELFKTDASRASTNALRQAFQLVAMIISIALTPMVTKVLQTRLNNETIPLRHA